MCLAVLKRTEYRLSTRRRTDRVTLRGYTFALTCMVQDINQALVDDGLVDMDKIGSSNFFWSFPSKAIVARQNIVDLLTRDIVKVLLKTRTACTLASHPTHVKSVRREAMLADHLL